MAGRNRRCLASRTRPARAALEPAETGTHGSALVFFKLIGEAYMTAGQLAEARGTIETDLAVAAQTGQLYFDSELSRPQGEIVLARAAHR